MKSIFMASVLWCQVFIVYGDAPCGGSYLSNYGEISSPNYPDNYPNDAYCTWTIEGGVNTRLAIVFVFCDLSSYGPLCFDYVAISQGSDTLFTSCKDNPERIITAGRNATIRFESNAIDTGKGFKLFWKVIPSPLFKRTAMSWKEAFATCIEDDGLLMKSDNSLGAAYSDSISYWMSDQNITEIWVRAYFTPWIWLKGCFRTNFKLLEFSFKDKQVCQDVCSETNFFGMQGYCSNKTTGENTETKVHCVFNCPENNQEVCGVNNALTIYKNDICFETSDTWNGTVAKIVNGDKSIKWNENNLSEKGPTQDQTDCIKLHRNGTKLNPVRTKCTEQLPFFCEKVPVNCGSIFVQIKSYFRYPPDGSNYSNDMNCEWKIVGFNNTLIHLDVVYEIERCYGCNCDSLKVYMGAKKKGTPELTFCGVGNDTFNSSTKEVTLVFRTDRTVQSKGVWVKWKFLTMAPKTPTTTDINARTTTADTSSIQILSTVSPKQGDDQSVNNKASVGLVIGLVIATLVAVTVAIFCIIVIRKKFNKTNEEIGNSLEMNSVEASTANQLQSNNHEYAVVSKKMIGSKIERDKKTKEVEEYSTVYNTENRSMINETDTETNITTYTSRYGKSNENHVHEDGTLDDTDYSYNVLNQNTSEASMHTSDNVYNHVQDIGNDAYDRTTGDLMKPDSCDTYSHVRGPYPS